VAFQTGRLLREDFLQQSAYDEIDSYCPLTKQYWMLKVIRHLHEAVLDVVDDTTDIERIALLDTVAEVARMRSWLPDDAAEAADELMRRVDEEVASL
jgi:V/A-type H+-transporting ATPase subunit A